MIKDFKKIEINELNPQREFLQTHFWAEFKKRNGFRSLAFEFSYSENKFQFLVLIRRIGSYSCFAYIPRFPSMSFLSLLLPKSVLPFAFFEILFEKLKKELPKDCMFIRIEPAFTICEDPKNMLKRDIDFSYCDKEHNPSINDIILDLSKFKKSVDVQVPDTIVLEFNKYLGADNSETVSNILKSMHKKTRYNINLSLKKNLSLVVDNDKVEDFYKLYEETAKRDSISIHNYQYYKSLFDTAKELKMDLNLLLAIYKDENGTQHILSGIVVLYYKDKAVYLYGASSNEFRNMMSNYFLQYHAIKMAIEKNCLIYDMFGIPSNANKDNKMNGLYRFKTSFGGNSVHYIGCWDYPLIDIAYGILSIAEKGRIYYHKNIRKKMASKDKNEKNPTNPDEKDKLQPTTEVREQVFEVELDSDEDKIIVKNKN